jgi:hypothetical protein
MRQQLESKAIEAVDLLDELDQSSEVPEQLHRIRGQDNFLQRKYWHRYELVSTSYSNTLSLRNFSIDVKID